jgi:hypothetical protein
MRAAVAILLVAFAATGARAADKITRQLPEAHRSIMGVLLAVSSRDDALKALGAAEAWPREDKLHDPFRYCYQLKSREPAWLILGFGWTYSFETLDSVEVTTDKRDLHGPCSNLEVERSKLSTGGGLRLGLAKSELKAIIADDPTTDRESSKYEYELYERYPEPVKHPGNPFLYVGEYHYGLIEVGFHNGKVSRFSLWIGGEPDW